MRPARSKGRAAEGTSVPREDGARKNGETGGVAGGGGGGGGGKEDGDTTGECRDGGGRGRGRSQEREEADGLQKARGEVQIGGA